jgi:hypothetical protein
LNLWLKEGMSMDKKMDRKTQTALLGALEAAKAHGQKLEDAREQRLWKKVNIPSGCKTNSHHCLFTELA